LPGVAYPGFRDNCSTLNTKTGYKKKSPAFFNILAENSNLMNASKQTLVAL